MLGGLASQSYRHIKAAIIKLWTTKVGG